MGQTFVSEMEQTVGVKSKFAEAIPKKPYFKNQKPLPANFSSILERKFQETE